MTTAQQKSHRNALWSATTAPGDPKAWFLSLPRKEQEALRQKHGPKPKPKRKRKRLALGKHMLKLGEGRSSPGYFFVLHSLAISATVGNFSQVEALTELFALTKESHNATAP